MLKLLPSGNTDSHVKLERLMFNAWQAFHLLPINQLYFDRGSESFMTNLLHKVLYRRVVVNEYQWDIYPKSCEKNNGIIFHWSEFVLKPLEK